MVDGVNEGWEEGGGKSAAGVQGGPPSRPAGKRARPPPSPALCLQCRNAGGEWNYHTHQCYWPNGPVQPDLEADCRAKGWPWVWENGQCIRLPPVVNPTDPPSY